MWKLLDQIVAGIYAAALKHGWYWRSLDRVQAVVWRRAYHPQRRTR